MKYYLKYVKDSMNHESIFDTHEELSLFLKTWLDSFDSFDDLDSNWIDSIYYGQKLEFGVTKSLKLDEPK